MMVRDDVALKDWRNGCGGFLGLVCIPGRAEDK